MKKNDKGIEFELNDKIVLNNGETVTFDKYAVMFGCNIFITKEDRGKDSYLLLRDIDEEKTIALNTINLLEYTVEDMRNLYLAKYLLEIWVSQGIDRIFKSSYRIRYYRDSQFTPIELFYDMTQRVFSIMEDLKDKRDSRLSDVIYDTETILKNINEQIEEVKNYEKK